MTIINTLYVLIIREMKEVIFKLLKKKEKYEFVLDVLPINYSS